MNLFDLLLLLFLALFAMIGTWRGFVRELVSLATWAAACLAAWLFSESLASLFRSFTQQPELRRMLAFAAIFLAVFASGMVIGMLLHRLVSRSAGLRLINRATGGVLGLARGVILAVILFLLAGLTALPQRDWWREALLTPAFERAALFAAHYLPPDIARHVRYG